MGYDSRDRLARRSVAFVAGLFVVTGCDRGVEIADHEVTAVVKGAVLDDALIGVAGAAVTVRAYEDDECDGPVWYDHYPPSLTGAGGSFQAFMLIPLVAPFRACLVVVAEPPTAVELRTDSVRGTFVDFGRSGGAPDTAVVSVVLSP